MLSNCTYNSHFLLTMIKFHVINIMIIEFSAYE